MPRYYDEDYLEHSSGPWKKHKYIKKEGDKYYYSRTKSDYKLKLGYDRDEDKKEHPEDYDENGHYIGSSTRKYTKEDVEVEEAKTPAGKVVQKEVNGRLDNWYNKRTKKAKGNGHSNLLSAAAATDPETGYDIYSDEYKEYQKKKNAKHSALDERYWDDDYLEHSSGPWKDHRYAFKKKVNGVWRYSYGRARGNATASGGVHKRGSGLGIGKVGNADYSTRM